jgi:Uma2 family endonuclease
VQSAQKNLSSAAEYLEMERRSPRKHEFLAGEVFAMAGGSQMHSLLATNLTRELGNRLKNGPCRVYNSDMRLKVEATEYYAYPDAQVACAERRFEGEKQDVLLNPKIIVEVFSDSTAGVDHSQKFWHYRHIESFQEYLLVSQDAWLIEHYVRQPNGGWLMDIAEGKDGILRLPTIQAEIPLTEIYSETDLPPNARPTESPRIRSESQP